MSLLKIVTWPNPILDVPADPVTKFDEDLKKLVNNMFETMYAAPGVGLAAVQVGVSKRLFVMDCSGGKNPAQRIVMINPEVIAQEGKQGTLAVLHFKGREFTRPLAILHRKGRVLTPAMKKFIESSNQHTPYLLRKAQRIEDYLNQR